MRFWHLVVPALVACRVQAKAVFAHFMVGNTASYTSATWAEDFTLAQAAHLDAFALNMAYGDTLNDDQVPTAFSEAEALGFKLFFSFDYAGNGAWPKADVLAMINKYASSSAYFKEGSQPLVSTFEGPASSGDWTGIKSSTGCLFVPDWSSLGAKDAVALDAADGLFSWAAWPNGPNNMNTYVDASYAQFMPASMPYMMPVSPWFYTNLPGYNKNWLWRGDSLWNDRWTEVLYWQPSYVEVLTWNDYGESHYIGPIRDNNVLDVGKAPYDFVTGMPHDGWRALLPFWIDMYKTGTATVSEEVLVVWYRINPASICSTGGTSGNTASQFEVEYPPYEIVQDRIYFNALLTAEASATVTIGGTAVEAEWSSSPWDGIGVYNGSAPINGLTGAVVVTVNGMSVTGKAITTSCTDGYTNFNAWVGSSSKSVSSVSPKLNLSQQNCTGGWAVGNFLGLCETSCYYGYCPEGACVCTSMGPLNASPKSTGAKGYPIAGEGSSYSGLCSFDCNIGVCPDTACGNTEVALTEPTVSPFTPESCTSGHYTSDPNYAGLCSYACNFGFCPIYKCTCDSTGTLSLPPDTIDGDSGKPVDSTDQSGLCQFACARGYCPSGACVDTGTTTTTTTVSPATTIGPGTIASPTLTGHQTGGDGAGAGAVAPIDQSTCPGDYNWAKLTCATAEGQANVSTALTAAARWSNAYAQDAFVCFEGWYYDADTNNKLGNLQNWETALAYFLGDTTKNMACSFNELEENCEQDPTCDGQDYTQAAFLLESSLVRMTGFYQTWWDGLDDILNKWGTIDDEFKETFAPDNEESLVQQFDEWALDQIFDAVSSGIFRGIEIGLPSSTSDEAKEELSGSYESLSDWIKEKILPSEDKDVPISEISALLTATVSSAQTAIGDYVDSIFNGSLTSMSHLYNQFRGGTWLNINNASVVDVRETTRAFIMAQLIPQVWALDETSTIVIVVSDTEDDTSNPFNGGGLDDAEAEDSRYSYDGQTFWIARMKTCTSWAFRTTTCSSTAWAAVHGHAALDGTVDSWGALSLKDMIVSSNEGKKLNGGKNGYVLSDTTGSSFVTNGDGETSVWAYEAGVQTPGVVSIPICSYKLAHFNWAYINREGNSAVPCATYPCCSCDQLDTTDSSCPDS